MNIVKIYYHIYSASTDSLSVSHETAAELQKSWLCKGCNCPKPNTENVDITIQESTVGNGPLNIIWGAGVGVARRDFLAEFGKVRIKRNFWLGRLFTKDDGEVKDWVTYRGKNIVIIRGRQNVKQRNCDVCGQFLYYAAGSRYLFPTPPFNIEIFESHLQGLVVGSEVFDRLTLFRWSKLYIEKVPVKSKAYDGVTIPPQNES